jgi:hypothetical protein
VIELECGITVYPARSEGGRWRAVWHEDGERQQCEAATEEKLAAKLELVKIRLEADAPNMRKPGAALIAHYLDPDRLPVHARWSRKHAHTQGRLCKLYAAPVIDAVSCQEIKACHMQAIVNAAPTAGEGDRVHRMLSALVTAGIDAGYLVNSRLARVHWQAGDRDLPAPAVSVAGEPAQWVDPAEIPSDQDIAALGRALAGGVHGDRDELMANTAAYSGLRWGELVALTADQVAGAAWILDETELAVRLLRQQLEDMRAPGVRARSGASLSVLEWAYIDGGHWDESLSAAQEASDVAAAYKMETVAGSADLATATILALRGQHEQVAPLLARMEAVLDTREYRGFAASQARGRPHGVGAGRLPCRLR